MSGAALPRALLAAILALAACCVQGEDYMGREEFLRLAFAGGEPQPQQLWLTEERRNAARAAVGLVPPGLRLRYWRCDERTAWILEEVGKEQPITIGVAIAGAKIERVEVLAFRESRGWEVRYPFFTAQFVGQQLGEDGYLSAPVDGITGATLSVRAVDRVARLALWLDGQVRG